MKIAVNASCCEDNFNGIGRFLWNLLKEWGDSCPHHKFTVFGRTGNFIREMPRAENIEYVISKPISLLQRVAEWEQFVLPFSVFRHGPFDAFFSPIYTLPFLVPTKRNILQIYDVSYLSQPALYTIPQRLYYRLFSALSLLRADSIITGSDFSYSEIKSHLNPKLSSLKMVYPGVESKFNPNKDAKDGDVLLGYGIKGRYCLYIGQIFTRRNVPSLIKAFGALARENKIGDTQLVIVGKNRTMPYVNLLELAATHEVADRVVFIESLPDDDMPCFYRNALFFAYLSSYEGFGLPVLESLSCGVPVLTTNKASLPEAGGAGSLQVADPEVITELKQSISELINNQSLRERLSKAGLEHSKIFRWSKCASETIKIIEMR